MLTEAGVGGLVYTINIPFLVTSGWQRLGRTLSRSSLVQFITWSSSGLSLKTWWSVGLFTPRPPIFWVMLDTAGPKYGLVEYTRAVSSKFLERGVQPPLSSCLKECKR